MKHALSAVASAVLITIFGCTLPLDKDNNSTPDTDTGVHGTIAKDTVWNASDVYIDGDLTITGKVTWSRKIVVRIKDGANVSISGGGSLTIQEGVLVKSGTGCYIEAGYSSAGTLIAKGSDSLPITFTKGDGVANWGYTGGKKGGILLYSNITDLTALDYCVIQYATAGLYVDEKTPPITRCKFLNNAGMGLVFDGAGAPKDSASFIKNEFTGNGDYPLSISAIGALRLAGSGGGTVFTTNGKQAIEIIDGVITENGTLRKHSVPYIVTGKIAIGKPTSGVVVTVEPGVVCKFDVDAYFEVGYVNPATLIANGTDSNKIVFTTSTAGSFWGYAGGNQEGGIWLGTKASVNCSFKNCVIEKATVGIYVTDVKTTIINCAIKDCKLQGIVFDGTASPKDSASFANDTLSGNGDYPFSIEAEQVTKLAGLNTVITGNTKQAIEVISGSVTETGFWRKHSVPYAITGKITFGKATTGVVITINPGTIFNFDVGAYFEVGYVNPATLIANGTDSNKIVFTTSTVGSAWGYNGGNQEGGIWIGTKATNNTSFKYCTIEKATNGMYVDEAKVTISNCTIKDCDISGIKFDGAAAPRDSASFVDDTISGNAEYAIEMSASQLGALSGTGSIAGNTLGGIYVNGDAITTTSNIWKKHNAAYIISDKVTIGSTLGASVTVRPGCQFIMAVDAYFEIGYVNPATFIADGTASAPITFAPAISGSSWGYDGGNIEGGIWIGDKSTTNTSFMYCSVGHATSGFYINKVAITIDHCTIHDCAINAITLDSGAPQTNFTNNTFTNNAGGDVVVQ